MTTAQTSSTATVSTGLCDSSHIAGAVHLPMFLIEGVAVIASVVALLVVLLK